MYKTDLSKSKSRIFKIRFLFNNRLRILVFIGTICLAPALSAEPLRIVSQNLNRFYDDVNNNRKYERVLTARQFKKRVDDTSKKIISDFKLADIIAFQEVENANVLSNISSHLLNKTAIHYRPILLPGNDISGINVGYLVKKNLSIRNSKQLFRDVKSPINGAALFSRPPLLIEVCAKQACISLLNLHLRSMRGMRQGKSSTRIRLKRYEQANKIAEWIEDFQQSSPNKSIMLLGDMNAFHRSDGYVDVIGTLIGNPVKTNIELKSPDRITTDLIDITANIPKYRRYSHIYKKRKQQLDYMLTNSKFKPVLNHISFGEIDYSISDHAYLMAEFDW